VRKIVISSVDFFSSSLSELSDQEAKQLKQLVYKELQGYLTQLVSSRSYVLSLPKKSLDDPDDDYAHITGILGGFEDFEQPHQTGRKNASF